MRSMTGYGRGQSAHNGTKFTVELNSVNRKQSDVTVNLPRELSVLEPGVRDVINAQVSRGRLNVIVAFHTTAGVSQKQALDVALAKTYFQAMSELQKELKAAGEISIETVLRAPGVLRMQEREGKHLAKDLIKHLKVVRQSLRKIRQLHPAVVRKYRQLLHERIEKAGLDIAKDDERLMKEVVFFADKSDISEELTRLDSHLAQFAHNLRKTEPIGRTLDFMTQEIYRELNTLGAKANDVDISQLVVTCKAEMEKIREQIQNIE